MKTSMLTFNLTFVSFSFFHSTIRSTQQKERTILKKSIPKQFLSENKFETSNRPKYLKLFRQFSCVFCWSFFTRKKGLENVFSQITCIFTNKWFIAGDSLLDRKEKTTPDRLEGFFYFIALCLKTIKSPFHPNAKQ